MPYVELVCNTILSYGQKLGDFAIPTMLAVVIALALFSFNSYKLFRVSLPFAAAVAGGYLGANLLGATIGTMVPSVSSVINPKYLAGIIVAVILAIVCIKFHNFAMVIIGGCVGYLVLEHPFKKLLFTLQFVRDLSAQAGPVVTGIVGLFVTIGLVIALAFLAGKYFKPVYIAVASAGAMTAATTILATFIFANTPIQSIAVLVAAGLGLIMGINAAVKQFNYWYLGL